MAKIPLEQLTKEEVIAKHRRFKRKMLTLIIIIAAVAAILIIQNLFNSWTKSGINGDNIKAMLNDSSKLQECENSLSNQTGFNINNYCTSKEHSEYYLFFKDAFGSILNLQRPWWQRFMIFLGIVYILQIMLALAMDCVEVIMMFFVIIKRSGEGSWKGLKWIFRKIGLLKPEPKETFINKKTVKK